MQKVIFHFLICTFLNRYYLSFYSYLISTQSRSVVETCTQRVGQRLYIDVENVGSRKVTEVKLRRAGLVGILHTD